MKTTSHPADEILASPVPAGVRFQGACSPLHLPVISATVVSSGCS